MLYRFLCAFVAYLAWKRTLLRPEELASIVCPVLIIQVLILYFCLEEQELIQYPQGEASPIAPLKYAEKLKQHLINVENEPRLYVVKGKRVLCSRITFHFTAFFAGAKACLNILPGSASIVNQVFSKFLAQQPRTRSDLVCPKTSIQERSKLALSKLAEFVGIPSIAQRDPRSPLSFSCVKADVAKSQLENLMFYAKDLDKAYCPLGRDGRPLRKSVPAFVLHSTILTFFWLQGTLNGRRRLIGSKGTNTAIATSVRARALFSPIVLHAPTDTSELKAARNYKNYKQSRSKTPSSPERPVAGSLTANKESLVTDEVAQDGRMRRTTYNANASSVDKHVIRGTMQKVVTQSAQLPKGIITKALLPS